MPSASKATYSLDPETAAKIRALATRWRVSKTEVLRRAVRQADEHTARTVEERIAALHALQKSLKDRGVDFNSWQQTIKDGRR